MVDSLLRGLNEVLCSLCQSLPHSHGKLLALTLTPTLSLCNRAVTSLECVVHREREIPPLHKTVTPLECVVRRERGCMVPLSLRTTLHSGLPGLLQGEGRGEGLNLNAPFKCNRLARVECLVPLSLSGPFTVAYPAYYRERVGVRVLT